MPSRKKEYNLYDLRPLRATEWEEGPDGKIVILVPKFRNALMVAWVLPFLRAKHFRVKLDDLGSAIWRQCDGTTSVATMGNELLRQFGQEAEPVYERISSFLRRLEHGNLITVPAPGAEVPGTHDAGTA